MIGRWLPDRRTDSLPSRPAIGRRNGRTRRTGHFANPPSHSLAGLRWVISTASVRTGQALLEKFFEEVSCPLIARVSTISVHTLRTRDSPIHPQSLAIAGRGRG